LVWVTAFNAVCLLPSRITPNVTGGFEIWGIWTTEEVIKVWK